MQKCAQIIMSLLSFLLTQLCKPDQEKENSQKLLSCCSPSLNASQPPPPCPCDPSFSFTGHIYSLPYRLSLLTSQLWAPCGVASVQVLAVLGVLLNSLEHPVGPPHCPVPWHRRSGSGLMSSPLQLRQSSPLAWQAALLVGYRKDGSSPAAFPSVRSAHGKLLCPGRAQPWTAGCSTAPSSICFQRSFLPSG